MITAEEYDEAARNGISASILRVRIETHKWDRQRAITRKPGRATKPESIYSVYKGDDFICMGNARECADALGFSSKLTIEQYATPSVRRRKEATGGYVVERIEEDEG